MNTQHLTQLITDLEKLQDYNFDMNYDDGIYQFNPCGCIASWVRHWYYPGQPQEDSKSVWCLVDYLNISDNLAEEIYTGYFLPDKNIQDITKQEAIDYLRSLL